MLRLRLDRASEEWVDLGFGVRLLVRPLTTMVMLAARRQAEAFAGGDQSEDAIGMAIARAVARACCVAWEGVGDENGQPVEVTPEGLDALLDHVQIFEAFYSRFLLTGVVLEREKKAFALSPSGTSAGAATIARHVKSRAPSAPTTSTPRKPRKAPKSGR